jgi:hypothetical protein
MKSLHLSFRAICENKHTQVSIVAGPLTFNMDGMISVEHEQKTVYDGALVYFKATNTATISLATFIEDALGNRVLQREISGTFVPNMDEANKSLERHVLAIWPLIGPGILAGLRRTFNE